MRCVVLAAALLAAALAAAPAGAHVPEAGTLTGIVERQGRPAPKQAAHSAPVQASGSAAPAATPRADCGPGSKPEPDLQGRVLPDAGDGYRCNIELLGRQGKSGGFKVLRFVDKAGHECAYYDTTLLFPTNIQNLSDQPTGVAVLDMSDPSNPVQTATLSTPAMQTPHESVVLNQRRGLLAAVMGNPTFYPGFVDIYDLNEDCRNPALQSSLPVGLLGHESGFAPDGNTFYATSLFTGQVTAVDVSNPKLPVTLAVADSESHGLTVSENGNRAYIADRTRGLVIADVSDIQARKPNPQFRVISSLEWPTMTVPQVAIPVTIRGKPYVVEIDEFSYNEGESGGFPAENGSRVGAARIIDISDETAPRVVSDMRLEVHQPQNRAKIVDDPGASSALQGYAGHYCEVPRREEPGIVACSFIASGLRVFDIRDPEKPRELAYFTAPLEGSNTGGEPSNYAMSAPAFAPERGEIWYSDGNSGFYALKVAGWPFRGAGGGGPGCRDRRAPRTTLRRGGLRAARVRVTLGGAARDRRPCRSGVRRVQVSLARVSGRTGVNCRFLKSRTRYRLTAPQNCRRPVLFTARGKRRWRFSFPVRLRPGRYRAQARATDAAGNKETPRARRNIVSFRVR